MKCKNCGAPSTPACKCEYCQTYREPQQTNPLVFQQMAMAMNQQQQQRGMLSYTSLGLVPSILGWGHRW